MRVPSSLRGLLGKHWGGTAAAALTLAVAIGGVTAAFSGLLVAVSDFPEIEGAERVARLWITDPRAGVERGWVSFKDLLEWERQTKTFEDLAGFGGAFTARMTGSEDSGLVDVQPVTSRFFRVLAARPLLGRGFSSAGEAVDGERVAILSYRCWRRRFGGDRAVVGRTVTLNGDPHVIVGVMPQAFWFPVPGDTVWVPLSSAQRAAPRTDRSLLVVGRLRPGFAWASAQAEMATIAERMRSSYPEADTHLGIRVVSLRQADLERLGVGLVGLMGPALLVLLVAAVNVGNLLLARAAVRERETAVRAALGASRLRLVRQLLAESTWLAATGGLGGLLLAAVGIRLIKAYAPPLLADRVALSPQVVVFGTLISLATPFLFGLLPAVSTSRPDLIAALKEGLGRRPVLTRGRYQAADLLVVAEVALAVVLVITSVFWLRFFWQLEHVELGFEPNGLLVADLSLSSSRYDRNGARLALASDLLERIRAQPGVEAVAVSDALPRVGEGAKVVTLDRAGDQPPGLGIELFRVSGRRPALSPVAVSPGFLETLGIPLLRGRDISEQDGPGSPLVALVSETVATTYWPGEDVLGRRFRFGDGGSREPWISIVGVVGDVMRVPGLRVPSIHAYRPYRQTAERHLAVVVRTAFAPGTAARGVRRAIEEADRTQPIDSLQTVEAMLGERFRGPHFVVGFLGAFTLLALFLAVIGVFAVASHSVARRTRELGVRMALGARARDLVWSAIHSGLALVATGFAIGLAGTLLVTRLSWRAVLPSALADPLLWAGALLPLMGAAVVAFYLPARRATRVDPAEALRHE